MYFFYNLALIVGSIIFLPVILVLFFIKPKFRAGFWQKIGFYKQFDSDKFKDGILLHAVSVGEVNAVEFLAKAIKEKYPQVPLVISTVTATGQEIAQKKLGNIADKVLYFPYDFSFSTNFFFKAFKFKKVIIAETEIWPGVVMQAIKNNIELYIVNGRISPNSYNGYKKISFFIRTILNKYIKILMQTKDDAARIVDIGASSELVKVMGNLKFDINKNLTDEQVVTLKNELNPLNSDILIAASTHNGEDEIVLKTFLDLKKKYSNLKLLIAPRHPQRFAQVEELLKKTGLNYGKRSLCSSFEHCEIIMLDTMGELSKMFALAKIAFIGGSFSSTGGHNPLEAAIWNVPVVSGPTVFNFKDIYKFMTVQNAATIVQSGDELILLIDKLLSNKEFYNKNKEATKLIFENNRGAIQKAISEIFVE